ncbi:hypothetical protein D3C72_2127160 [compost metagenome]
MLHLRQIFTHHVNGGFVHDALKLRAGEIIGFLGDLVEIDAFVQRLVLGMQLQN